jgi:phosphoribosylformimino-5-aminoimidazole carboxamide ribotide isomerase
MPLMELYPAIDILGGRCVRLRQGDYADATTYGSDPVGMALSFAAEGARWIHVVDLDAARTGSPVNRPIISALTDAVGVSGVWVQTGGGVRDRASIDALRASGVARVVVGTAAVRDPSLGDAAAADWPGGVAVGLDFRHRPDGGCEVAVHGWTEGSGVDLFELVRRFDGSGAAALVVTEIGRDGMLSGPDVDGLGRVLEATSAAGIVASGGVSSVGDLEVLAGLERAGRRLAGAITGKAVYEGRFGVAEALAVLARVGG